MPNKFWEMCARCEHAIDPCLQGGYVEQVVGRDPIGGLPMRRIVLPYHRLCWLENERTLDMMETVIEQVYSEPPTPWPGHRA